jgi:hypothetical protein
VVIATQLQQSHFKDYHLIDTVKPGYKDPGYKDILTNKDTILSPEQICIQNKDNLIPLNILLISRSLVRKYTKFSLT